MTVKRNGEKVILKGGKVSCSCCDEEECCMYPAQALADGFYSASDLPDAVTISGVSYSRSGLGYGNTTNGVILEENVWARYTNGSRSSRACLIQGGVEDQFADTYTVDIASGALVVQVERFAVYGWISEVIQEGDNYFCIILAYCEYGGPSYGFGLTKSNNFDNQTDASAQRQSYIDKLIYVFQTGLNPKIGFNNTPEGSYPWFSTTATVS
jgi:hypothetical protein